jgi:hypothetical protein
VRIVPTIEGELRLKFIDEDPDLPQLFLQSGRRMMSSACGVGATVALDFL